MSAPGNQRGAGPLTLLDLGRALRPVYEIKPPKRINDLIMQGYLKDGSAEQLIAEWASGSLIG